MPEVSEVNVRDALARVAGSREFATSPRLREFLCWVVEEWLAGRSASISGKAIAVDVYGRDVSDDESGLNLVRVEARRLRRRLERYYDLEGQADPWRIRIDKGGYTPRFEEAVNSEPAGNATAGKPARARIAAFAIAAAALALLVETMIPGRHPEIPADETESETAAAERSAIGARSMVSLQAVNLASQGRNLLFPVFDITQQELALAMFRHVIELDPGLHHGYAGSAQVLGVLSLLEADPSKAATLRAEAMDMANAALQIAPTNAWALAASAYVLAVGGSAAEATEQARLAVSLAPDDGHILDLAGITAIVAGDGRFAAEVSDPLRPRSGVERFGADNIWGVAQYMSGNYEEAIEAFAGAAEAGASISAPSLVFLAVSLDHAGDTERAADAVIELRRSWPNFPLAFVVGRMFQNKLEYRDDIVTRIGKYSSITLSES